MDRWKIEYDNITKYYENFSDAVDYFRSCIYNYIIENDEIFAKSCIPFQPEVFYHYKFENGIITDEEIAVGVRAKRLLDTLSFPSDCLKDNDSIKNILIKDIHYTGCIEEFYENVKVNATKSKDEIVLELIHFDVEETYLKTNAFIFDDCKKDYYFDSHQIINTTSNHTNLGKHVDLNITLKYE